MNENQLSQWFSADSQKPSADMKSDTSGIRQENGYEVKLNFVVKVCSIKIGNN